MWHKDKFGKEKLNICRHDHKERCNLVISRSVTSYIYLFGFFYDG